MTARPPAGRGPGPGAMVPLDTTLPTDSMDMVDCVSPDGVDPHTSGTDATSPHGAGPDGHRPDSAALTGPGLGPGGVGLDAAGSNSVGSNNVGSNSVGADGRRPAARGVMGRLVAATDWAGTALGPAGEWSPTLRMAVSLCLDSGFPKALLWGPELVMIYNDAYLPILGHKHPRSLGRPFRQAWPETWEIMGPALERVLAGGAAVSTDDQLLLLDRRGYQEECHFTLSLSPVRDVLGDGGVAGVMATGRETTRQVFATRRLTCLRELATATADSYDPWEVCTRVVEVLGRYPADVSYGIVLLRDPDAQRPVLRPAASCGLAGDQRGVDLLGVLGAEAPLPELGDALFSGQARLVRELPERFPIRLASGCRPPGSAIAAPLAEGCDGLAIGLLLVGVNDRLAPDDDYRDFVELLAGQISTAVVVARAGEVERARAADARYRALHDGLTGLPNRTALLDRLHQALTGARGDRPRRVAILFVDLDGFKTVNDSLGHHAGDDLLREVAGRLRRAVRPGDTVARFSGDEFAILCEGVTAASCVEAVAERLVSTLAIPRTACERTITVTASVGIAVSGPDLSDPEDILHAADIAMYAAKRQGRSCHMVFDERMRAQVRRRVRTGNDLRRALVTDELRLLYQPVMNMAGELTGVEALLRWQHPERGLLEPDAFLAVAEETGLIVPLGRRVLEMACRAAGRWASKLPAGMAPRVAIDVSACQLADPRFLSEIIALLEATNADDRYELGLEITESAFVDDVPAVTAALHDLCARGVSLYVDDFGAGHSSLSCLHRAPLDGIKIDKRRVARMLEDPAEHAVVAAVIGLAHTFGLTAVANGVETPEQLAALRTLRCDLVQGCFLASPQPGLPSLLHGPGRQPTATEHH
ncbi:EAL domain-containing protein [Frankia sp. CiP1_Cm_nod1]|uniref:EAL domain-containing protein n=1 Tax=Frankia sp. CiP1_Cm_nod1 TaxID=2897160 RepID=UPI00202487B8